MKFSTRVDIEAPVEAAFAALADFPAFERAAIRKGAEVSRGNPAAPIAPGSNWSIRFPYRGKMRRLLCTLESLDPPNSLGCALAADGFAGTLTIAAIALSRSRCRIQVQLEIRPQTLKARVIVQSAKLNRASYVRRFEARVNGVAQGIERGLRGR